MDRVNVWFKRDKSWTFLSYHSGEKLKAIEFISMRVMDEGRVDGLGQDQEQAMDGKEEEVKEQEGPQKQEVGEHPWSKACAQPLHGSVPQTQWVEKREAFEEAVLPSLRKKKTKTKHKHDEYVYFLNGLTGSKRLGLTFEMCTLTRLKHGIFLLKRELSGTSLNARHLIKDQERGFYYSHQGEAICIVGFYRFFFLPTWSPSYPPGRAAWPAVCSVSRLLRGLEDWTAYVPCFLQTKKSFKPQNWPASCEQHLFSNLGSVSIFNLPSGPFSSMSA